MMKALFLFLCLFPMAKALAQTPVEIYADGHKYASLQDYKAAKDAKAINDIKDTSVPVQSQEDFIQSQSQKLGLKVNWSKVKTLELAHDTLSESTMHRLYVLSVEKGVTGALQNFYQSFSAGTDFYLGQRISSAQIQEAIKKAVTASVAPKLLISGSGKVRIMTITPDDAHK